MAAVLGFLGVTIWWLTQDTRVPDWDSAKHTLDAFVVHDDITSGNLLRPFTEFNNYPPLGHLIGALGVFIGGHAIGAVILALNLVFVPVLAWACYGVGRSLAGPRAGLLAAVFALGTPMIVSEAHEAYLDPLQAAMVALSVYAILRSNRFEDVRMARLAGLATALAFLTKQTTPVFLAGLLIVVIARGGWRNRRGLVDYCVVIAVIAAPWYLAHVHGLFRITVGVSEAPVHPLAGIQPSRLSLSNLTWYFWNAANIQLRAALLLLLIAGVFAAVRSSIRDRSPSNVYPELLGGGLVSVAGMTWLSLKDPRYDLPALVYMAVLATAWIPNTRPRLRPSLVGALLVSVAASFASVVGDLGGSSYRLRVALPSSVARTFGERFITVYSTSGWLRGPPESNDGDMRALIRALGREGVGAVSFCCNVGERGAADGGAELIDFNVPGLSVLTRESGLRYRPNPAALKPDDVFLVAHSPIPGDPPCQRLRDGEGIYAVLGNPVNRPVTHYTFICPGRRHEIYGYASNVSPPT